MALLLTILWTGVMLYSLFHKDPRTEEYERERREKRGN